MADFPTFAPTGGFSKEDASKFGIELEDTGIRSTMEGGYVITRARHTRAPRRTWTTGFTDLSSAEFNTFLAFFSAHGTYQAFTYAVRTSNELVDVRFASVPTYKYTGHGLTMHWDISDIKLEEV